jgi:hypothetical protein
MAKKKAPVMLQMVIRKVADLIPNLANTKTHPEEQVDEICASIKACGYPSASSMRIKSYVLGSEPVSGKRLCSGFLRVNKTASPSCSLGAGSFSIIH